MTFSHSETCQNLMRAFAGESQARNRYTFAAACAKQQQNHLLEAVFLMTANQELAHAEQFFACLQQHGVTNVNIQAGYPVDPEQDLLALLEAARHNEMEEFDPVYPSFAQTAAAEGFAREAYLFRTIAAIEHSHANRFADFHKRMLEERLWTEPNGNVWFCLNCGHLHEGSEAPTHCPVCGKPRGWFVRAGLAPFTEEGGQTGCVR